MLVIWSGPGLRAVVIIAFIVSVFPVIASTLAGLLSTDPALEDLFRLYGSGPIARLWKLRLPSALPGLLTGLRVAAGLSVIGTVVAEFLVGTFVADEGLGAKIVSNVKYGHTDAVFAQVLLASLLGLAMFSAVNLAGKILLRRWHPSEL
jgi:NitT/TauT family transport system permease protein